MELDKFPEKCSLLTEKEWLSGRPVYTPIGAYPPTHREIPKKTISSAFVYVDSITSAFSEARDLIIPLNPGSIRREQVKGEIGQLIPALNAS